MHTALRRVFRHVHKTQTHFSLATRQQADPQTSTKVTRQAEHHSGCAQKYNANASGNSNYPNSPGMHAEANNPKTPFL